MISFKKKTAVVAIGGNAILQPNDDGSAESQLEHIESTADFIAGLIRSGYKMVITHGNGPQVGNILLKNEVAGKVAPPMPMDICVAESQGQIGYMIQQSLRNRLEELDIDADVAALITQVVVSGDDDAFEDPTKPIGPYYTEDEAREIAREKGWNMIEDRARGGYRRVVPSPEPIEIVESSAIRAVLSGVERVNIVIAAGGGGVPVVRTEHGYRGVEAVVDKDLSSQVLANSINAHLLIMLTDVDRVALNYGKPEQRFLDRMTLSEARKYLREGHFPAGSMGPKVLSAVRFIENGGEMAVITTPKNMMKALEGEQGTWVVAG